MENSCMTPAAPDWPGEKARVQRLRRRAAKLGLRVRKSRRMLSFENYGGYTLWDPARNTIVAGQRYDLSSDALAEILEDMDGSPEYQSAADIIMPTGQRLGDCKKADVRQSMKMYEENMEALQRTYDVLERAVRAH